jgi:polyisoprenoid-binding protein YceI
MAARAAHTRSSAVPAQPGPCLDLGAGRWLVDGHRSALQVSVKVGMFATARGRFHEVAGQVDVAPEHLDSTVQITVRTASLSSGSQCMDTLLHGAGIIDSAANPTISFVGRALRPVGDGSYLLDGLLTTDGAVLDVTLRMAAPRLGGDGAVTLTASGELTSKDAVRLLSRPGVEKMLGRTMALDLTVVVVRD